MRVRACVCASVSIRGICGILSVGRSFSKPEVPTLSGVTLLPALSQSHIATGDTQAAPIGVTILMLSVSAQVQSIANRVARVAGNSP